jgi:hypothetical protein
METVNWAKSDELRLLLEKQHSFENSIDYDAKIMELVDKLSREEVEASIRTTDVQKKIEVRRNELRERAKSEVLSKPKKMELEKLDTMVKTAELKKKAFRKYLKCKGVL